MRNIEISFDTREIIITKKFKKAARWYGSYAYRDLKQAMEENPTFTVRTKESHVANEGLTYRFMERYISSCDMDGSLMDEFNEVKCIAAASMEPAYNLVKKWFLSRFPEAIYELPNSPKRITEIVS